MITEAFRKSYICSKIEMNSGYLKTFIVNYAAISEIFLDEFTHEENF